MVLCVQHVELAVFGVRWSKVRQIQVVNTWVATTCSLCDLGVVSYSLLTSH